ncbi:glycosyltransferase WbuB [Roseiconus lacunae]|uniref:glycosyltransferase WbuB n=1 Tax=Roseiconus lacunae TaxID=2605694 RepID=UPI0011F39E51|nr:glycosyltransferase WbuB [Roseiconus lacunae]
MNILLYGLNYSPEEIGIGKYSGEMVQFLADQGHHVTVVTTPPYYPDWKVGKGYKAWAYKSDISNNRSGGEASGTITVIRCPIWVPKQVNGLKRILHLASFAGTSLPVVLWKALRRRHEVVMTVEPAAFCMPATLVASLLRRSKSWLHVQDFEVDAAFELGILKQPLLKRLVLAAEAFLMRRFNRVSSISPNMVFKLIQKGVAENRCAMLPNWVDCTIMRPLGPASSAGDGSNQKTALERGSDRLRIDPAAPSTPPEKVSALAGLRDSFGLPIDKCLAMYAGNIGAKQGLEIILETAREHADRTDLAFVICGTGAAHQELLQRSEGIGNIHWLPVQPLSRFNELMNCADIHLLPQRAGAADLVMPSKLTGMLATGRPIVACAAPGTQIADVVRGRGLVVLPDDVEAFSHAVIQLAESSDLRIRLGQAGREYAVNHLSRLAVLSKFESDLQTLVGDRNIQSNAVRQVTDVTPDTPDKPDESSDTTTRSRRPSNDPAASTLQAAVPR